MSADERRERQALLGLAIASLPKEDKVREAFRAEKGYEPPTLAEALKTLTELTKEGKRRSHRLFYLDLLAKITHRQGFTRLESEKAALYELLEVAVVEGEAARTSDKVEQRLLADAPDPEPALVEAAADDAAAPAFEHLSADGRVNGTVDALRQVSLRPDEHDHWTEFALRAQPHLQLAPEEIDRPLCTDDQPVVMPNGKTATRTAVWFWSDRPASDFAHWTDPRGWARDCSLFFKSVDLKKGQTIPANAQEFTATFTETVCVDGDSTLSTDLVFSRCIRSPDLYALEFDLPDPPSQDAEILVDAGQVTVRSDPNAPPSRRTALLAEKYILFKDPAFADWPTVACDLFWIEFAIVMARGCAADQ